MEKCPGIGLFCHSDYGGAVAGFDVNDCDEVGQGGVLTDAMVLSSREHRHGRSMPI